MKTLVLALILVFAVSLKTIDKNKLKKDFLLEV